MTIVFLKMRRETQYMYLQVANLPSWFMHVKAEYTGWGEWQYFYYQVSSIELS
jgi:hypothetical protein